MTRRTTITFVNLSLCAMLALIGCKSSDPLGLAKKSAPAATQTPDQATAVANTQLALAKANETPVEPEVPAFAQEPTEGFSLARTLKSATSWLPFQKREGEEGRESQALDRELTLRPVPSSAGRFGPTPTSATPQSDTATNPASYTPADWRTGALTRPDAARSTPSLVRRSRRPPPDPAPKPPQEELLAQQTLPRTATTATKHTSLARKIVLASRSWQIDMAKAKAASLAAAPNAQPKPRPETDNSDLKFVPPQIAKKQTNNKSAELAQTTKGGQEKDPAKTPKAKNTIPRRSDLIAKLQKPAKPEADAQSKAQPSAKETKTSQPNTRWMAKKTDSAAKPSLPALDRETPKSVVAETFAARQPISTPVTESRPGTAQRPPAERSEFPLNKPLASNSKSPQYITNPHTGGAQPTVSLEPENTVTQTPVTGHADPSTRPLSSPDSPRPTTPRPQPTQLASSGLPTARPSQTAPTARLERPSTAWRQPVPFAPSGQNGHQAYYQRGLVQQPGTAIPSRQPQQPVVAAVQPAYGTMQVPENVAPLINADTYRQQRNGAVIPVTTPQPAPRGTWLAAYQKLMGRDRNHEQVPPANVPTGNGATRSLRSGQ